MQKQKTTKNTIIILTLAALVARRTANNIELFNKHKVQFSYVNGVQILILKLI